MFRAGLNYSVFYCCYYRLSRSIIFRTLAIIVESILLAFNVVGGDSVVNRNGKQLLFSLSMLVFAVSTNNHC